jgi:hypothetical protein
MYTSPVWVLPSVLPFITQGDTYLSSGPGSGSTLGQRTIPYDQLGVLEQLLTGIDQWPGPGAFNITVDYATMSKLVLDIPAGGVIPCDETGFTDEYITSQFPSWRGDPDTVLVLAGLEPKELLGLFESYFGDVEEVLERLDCEEISLAEFGGRSRPGGRFRPELQEESELHLEMDDRLYTDAKRLWYDLFHPDSPVRIELPEQEAPDGGMEDEEST